MRARLGRILLRLVGPLILLALIVKLDAQDRTVVASALAGAAPSLVALAAVLNLLNIHLKVVRWEALLAVRGIAYPRKRAYAAFMSSLYVGMLTPGRVGDVLRVQYLQREAGVPYSEGLASVVADRFADLYVLAVFVGIAIAHYGRVLDGALAYAAWGGVAATVLLPLVFLLPGPVDRTLRRVYAKLSPDKSEEAMRRFLEALRAQLRPSLAFILVLTAITVLVTHAQGYLVARALGFDIGFFDVMCLLSVANLLGLLPISISGLGVREYFYQLVFPTLGLAASLGVVYGLVVFAIVYLVLVAIGAVSWQIAPPPVGQTARGAEERNV